MDSSQSSSKRPPPAKNRTVWAWEIFVELQSGLKTWRRSEACTWTDARKKVSEYQGMGYKARVVCLEEKEI